MRVVVATDAWMCRLADGSVRTPVPADAYPMWSRYLDVFDSVTVLARMAGPPRPSWSTGADDDLATDLRPAAINRTWRADGPGVDLHGLTDYRGPAGYLRALPALRRAVGRGLAPGGALTGQLPGGTCYLARMPGMIGSTLVAALRRRGLPYALEVVGDPAGMARAVLGPWAGERSRRRLARVCAGAVAVSYVTRHALQLAYPPAEGALTACYSTARLAEQDYTAAPRGQLARPPSPARLLTIGSQDYSHKGHDVLLEAAARLAAHRDDIVATIVGSGRRHRRLVAQARDHGIADIVTFVPMLDRPGIRAALDAADLFVLPSRTEGLPRVLLEAAARGVPAVATSVGGTAELLAGADLVAPDNPGQLAARISEVLASPRRLAAMSARNRATAEQYRAERLQGQARSFYREFARRVACGR